MKKPAIKITLGIILMSLVFGIFWLRFPFPGALGWPAFYLAQEGFRHSWISLILLVYFFGWVVWRSRGLSFPGVVLNTVSVPTIYCLAAYFLGTSSPIPLAATTPYDNNPDEKALYLEFYEDGYRNSRVGCFMTYCFRPPLETKGLEDGDKAARLIWSRAMGGKP